MQSGPHKRPFKLNESKSVFPEHTILGGGETETLNVSFFSPHLLVVVLVSNPLLHSSCSVG